MVKRICKICGVEFEAIRKTKKYCSSKCSSKAYYSMEKKKGAFKGVCIKCGSEFSSTKLATKYCSISCSNAMRTLKEDRKQHKNKCEICSIEFLSIHKKARFCSPECNRKDRLVEEGKIMIDYVCEECEQSYQRPKSHNPTRFCGNSCSVSNMHRTMPEERKQEMRKRQSASAAQGWIEGKHDECGFGKNWSYIRGYFYSKKLDKDIYYRSRLEKTYYEALDESADVVFFAAEPFKIKYEDTTSNPKQTRHYVPDVLVFFKDGRIILVEIKPKHHIKSAINQSKFKAAREYCKSHGYKFEVWTENDIKALTTPPTMLQ